MKKCAKLTLAFAAVVLFTAGEAWARAPQGSKSPSGSTSRHGVATTGKSHTTTGSQSLTQTQKHLTKQGTSTTPMSGNFSSWAKANQLHQHLGLPSGASAAFAGSHFPQQWQQQANWVRNNVQGRYSSLFTPQWYASHPNAWHVAHPHADMWAAVAWPALAGWVGVTGAYVPYGYDAVYESNTYYINDEGMPVAEESEMMVEQFNEDPAELAAQGQSGQAPSTNDPNQWLPLGVFTITAPEAKTMPSRLFQFAINKNGQLAGSYYDTFSGQTMPIQGAVNKNTQHVAWTIGSHKQTVMETSLGSFTQNHSGVTVYSTNGPTEQWMMVRLEQPNKTPNVNSGTNQNTSPSSSSNTNSNTNSSTNWNTNSDANSSGSWNTNTNVNSNSNSSTNWNSDSSTNSTGDSNSNSTGSSNSNSTHSQGNTSPTSTGPQSTN
jgi:hypothetical protein